MAMSTPSTRQPGEERWRVRIGSSVNSLPTVVGGVLYIGSDDGYVYAIADSNEG